MYTKGCGCKAKGVASQWLKGQHGEIVTDERTVTAGYGRWRGVCQVDGVGEAYHKAFTGVMSKPRSEHGE